MHGHILCVMVDDVGNNVLFDFDPVDHLFARQGDLVAVI